MEHIKKAKQNPVTPTPIAQREINREESQRHPFPRENMYMINLCHTIRCKGIDQSCHKCSKRLSRVVTRHDIHTYATQQKCEIECHVICKHRVMREQVERCKKDRLTQQVL